MKKALAVMALMAAMSSSVFAVEGKDLKSVLKGTECYVEETNDMVQVSSPHHVARPPEYREGFAVAKSQILTPIAVNFIETECGVTLK